MAEALRLAAELDQYLYSVPAHPLCTDAAAELRRLHAENELLASAADKLRMSHSEERRELLRQRDQATAQRDALLKALKSTGLFLHHCWCDVQMNDYSFEKLNRQMEIVDAAIKAVEEGK